FRALGVLVVLHAWLVLDAMARTPQLYSDAWYARGGVRRVVQIFATDVLGARGTFWLGVAIAIAYLAGPRASRRAKRRGRGLAARPPRVALAARAGGARLGPRRQAQRDHPRGRFVSRRSLDDERRAAPVGARRARHALRPRLRLAPANVPVVGHHLDRAPPAPPRHPHDVPALGGPRERFRRAARALEEIRLRDRGGQRLRGRHFLAHRSRL